MGSSEGVVGCQGLSPDPRAGECSSYTDVTHCTHFPEQDSGATPTQPTTPSGPHRAQTWLEGVLRAVGSHRATGPRGKWQCPGHARTGEHSVALGVGTRTDGTGAWLHCHAGCSAYDVLATLGLTFSHLRHPPLVTPERHVAAWRLQVGFPTPKAGSGSPRELGYRHEAFHYYGADHRKERLRHPVTGAKSVLWECRNPRGEWVPGLLGTREADLELYREHDVKIGIAMGEPVVLVESESTVDALVGLYGTTWAGGASSPPLVHLREVLGGYDRVVFIADADDAGRRCARLISGALPLARIVQPGLEGEDARDLYARLGPAEFATALEDVLTAGVAQ